VLRPIRRVCVAGNADRRAPERRPGPRASAGSDPRWPWGPGCSWTGAMLWLHPQAELPVTRPHPPHAPRVEIQGDAAFGGAVRSLPLRKHGCTTQPASKRCIQVSGSQPLQQCPAVCERLCRPAAAATPTALARSTRQGGGLWFHFLPDATARCRLAASRRTQPGRPAGASYVKPPKALDRTRQRPHVGHWSVQAPMLKFSVRYTRSQRSGCLEPPAPLRPSPPQRVRDLRHVGPGFPSLRRLDLRTLQ